MQSAARWAVVGRKWKNGMDQCLRTRSLYDFGKLSRAVHILRASQDSVSKCGSIELTSHSVGRSEGDLFHKRIDVVMREGHLREKRSMRRDGMCIAYRVYDVLCVADTVNRIPSYMQGRGKLPDVMLSVPSAPLKEDYSNGLFAKQKLAKIKWAGPLYQLRFVDGAVSESGDVLPFMQLRVKAVNMQLHPLKEYPLMLTFVYSPEDEPVRVRVPIRYINEEKSPGLRDSGWLNRIVQDVDINVAPFTKAPLYATLDVAGMVLKSRKRLGDLQFEGKGNGCRLVLSDDTVMTVISKA